MWPKESSQMKALFQGQWGILKSVNFSPVAKCEEKFFELTSWVRQLSLNQATGQQTQTPSDRIISWQVLLLWNREKRKGKKLTSLFEPSAQYKLAGLWLYQFLCWQHLFIWGFVSVGGGFCFCRHSCLGFSSKWQNTNLHTFTIG